MFFFKIITFYLDLRYYSLEDYVCINIFFSFLPFRSSDALSPIKECINLLITISSLILDHQHN